MFEFAMFQEHIHCLFVMYSRHVMSDIVMTVFVRLLHPCFVFVFLLIARIWDIKLYTPSNIKTTKMLRCRA